MTIADIPEFRDKDEVFTMELDTPLLDAVKIMSEKNYGSVVVTKKGKLAGIVTERDLMRRVINDGKDPKKLALKDIMTPDPKTARTDDTVADSLRRMTNGKFRHLPIVNDNSEPVGMISQGDFVAYSWPQIMHRAKQNAESAIPFGATQMVGIFVAILLYTFALIAIFNS